MGIIIILIMIYLEIYFLVAEALSFPTDDCLMFEDSPVGVRAGSAAIVEVITNETELTHMKLHLEETISSAHILEDFAYLQATANAMMEIHTTLVYHTIQRPLFRSRPIRPFKPS